MILFLMRLWKGLSIIKGVRYVWIRFAKLYRRKYNFYK